MRSRGGRQGCAQNSLRPARSRRSARICCPHHDTSRSLHPRPAAAAAAAALTTLAPPQQVADLASSAAAAAAADRYQVVDLNQQTAEIRRRLFQDFLAGGVIYLASGDLKLRNGTDVFHKFRADSNFAYLTGVHEPGFACLLDTSGSGSFTLLAPRVPAEAAVWWGGVPSLEECAEAAGADRCIYLEDLAAHLQQHHRGQTLHLLEAPPAHAPAPTSGQPIDPHAPAPSPTPSALAGMAAAAGMQVNGGLLLPHLRRSRARKTDAEVACLLHANRVSGAAHQAMWRAARPGSTEYMLEAEFVAAAMRGGLPQLGYPCIVGAGANAGVLHYECKNAAVVGERDLVLVDAGAEFRCYTADITRTFPASGSFEAAQRDVYEAVLAAQQHALQLIAPGALWKDVDAAARQVLLCRLRDMGLVRGSLEALLAARLDRVFMPHGLGHHLGLDVHDVAEEGPVPLKLAPGQVVTCEPGCYFMPLLLERAARDAQQAPLLNLDALQRFAGMGGVRIEDNVAVTEDGSFNLTVAAGVPKEAAAVEAIVSGRH